MPSVDGNPPVLDMRGALTILRELDRALSYHLHWLKDLHRILICDEPARADDKAQDAHCRCKFGQWLYGLDPDVLAREPGILELGAPHRAMHDAARLLLQENERHGRVDAGSYETFMDLSTEFKQRMREYQFQLVQRVCTVDHLTGVWNRNILSMRLAAEAERARRGFQTCAISLLDLDLFKLVNDRYGHPVGDKVLHAVAQFLQASVRAYDSLFRYGGEEFLICLPDTGLADAEQLLNRLRERLASHPIEIGPGQTIRITASFGVAALNHEDAVTDVIARADHALLSAKSKGRNAVCAWDISDGAGNDGSPRSGS